MSAHSPYLLTKYVYTYGIYNSKYYIGTSLNLFNVGFLTQSIPQCFDKVVCVLVKLLGHTFMLNPHKGVSVILCDSSGDMVNIKLH